MNEVQVTTDTIVAQATAPGRGGVGIIRVSGPEVTRVAQSILGYTPKVRYADYCEFKDSDGQVIDQGIALFFKAPNSFTGEDVLELQGHGGQVVLDMLIKRVLETNNVRTAKPGEFSEQAFMNDKLDLTQAEAIADLIDASSEQAAKSALHSLQGEFSAQIHQLVDQVTNLRLYVEAAIDFPDEEVDFLSDGKIANSLYKIIDRLSEVQNSAEQGALIREGMKVVIAGRPNAGKSSLLNALAGKESAIVTEIAGTTRDVLREHIHIDGMPLHIIDTAGLRNTDDAVEKIGIERAWDEINQADQVLFMVDATTTNSVDPHDIWPEFIDRLPKNLGVTVVRNKADVTQEPISISNHKTSNELSYPVHRISAKNGDGMHELKQYLKSLMGYQSNLEGGFIARRRHLQALELANQHLFIGKEQLEVYQAGELLAEELRMTQLALSEITGQFTSDDLLGKIFSSFCIGK
ncbi:tRNA uridine-5-carboxymethylaminomethyl(34) synthesis GTPase MnmE [Parashewanella spongiae]|uniref:tRNA uridine-5-carboxymethylaminomethyl(34) synthesis GTPase MnmE n=1 Tax=Parashewanella spongiae TaxID=342950 RepID=UPI001A9CD369|nr:tRNA uridine-5-carboxymethylaminomethyl(34) synthesis GTPase MnmE [Parashewanella spongiae]MCL1079406.1 tRNA uridine-5-carboxymethylaminomethyl(34) synthesis GTPase MnmE [Parashewanella spongiae]